MALPFEATYVRAALHAAQSFAKLSVAERLKVGCVIMSGTGSIISAGHNHMPDFMDPCCENADGTSSKFVVHAEHDAIRKCNDRNRLMGAVAIVTHQPCDMCAEKIISAGINFVVYAEEYRLKDGLRMLIDNGIHVYHALEDDLYQVHEVEPDGTVAASLTEVMPHTTETMNAIWGKDDEVKGVKKWIHVDRHDETTWHWGKPDAEDFSYHSLLVELFDPMVCNNSYDVQVENTLAGMRATGAFNI